MDDFWVILDDFWVILDDFWVILDDFWVILDDFWVILDDFWVILDDFLEMTKFALRQIQIRLWVLAPQKKQALLVSEPANGVND